MSTLRNNLSSVLIVAPHHDDEVIGCGGTIAFLSDSGCAIDVAYMTAGYSGIPHVTDQAKAIALREAEAYEVGRILGIRQQMFLRHPDRDLGYSLKQVHEIVKILRSGGYSGVCFPHEAEQDYEHRVVHQIVGEAVWLAASSYFPELGLPLVLQYVMMYEVWTPLQVINLKQDISQYVDLKINALAAYASQFTSAQAERIVGLNAYRAAMTNQTMRAAEVFRFHSR